MERLLVTARDVYNALQLQPAGLTYDELAEEINAIFAKVLGARGPAALSARDQLDAAIAQCLAWGGAIELPPDAGGEVRYGLGTPQSTIAALTAAVRESTEETRRLRACLVARVLPIRRDK